jgi:predicted permease
MALWSSMRFSLRILRKHWKLTSIAVSSLAIAMTAGTAGFSVFNALLLQPPAVLEPHRLLTVYSSAPTEEFSGFCYDDYAYFRDHNESFSGLMAFPYSISMMPVAYEKRTKTGLTNTVSDTYFAVLGVPPLLGRTFERGDDDKPSALAVLSYSYWRWLGSNPNIVGTTVSVNNVPLTVIGVMPKGFVGTIFSDLPDVWYPLSTDVSANHQGLAQRADRTNRSLHLVGRLKPGVTREQALANLQTISAQLASAYPATNKDRIAHVTHSRMLPEDSVSSARTISAIIFVIVGLILFAACSNVATLLLALAGARRHEFLVRAALGATRKQLIGEVLVDSTLIAGASGVLGLFLAFLALRQLLQFKPYFPGLGSLPLTINFLPDVTVMAAVGALVFLVGLATGVVPSIYAATPNLAAALSGEIAVGGTRKGRIRNFLVGVQVAVCTLVFIGVGLCFRSLENLRNVDLGFTHRNIAMLTADLQAAAASEDEGRQLYARIRETASQLSGIESVSIASDIPVSQNGGNLEQIRVADGSAQTEAAAPVASAVVDDNFFSTLGIRLLAGRVFTSTDTPKGPEAIVINHWMAEKYWPGQTPVGKTVHIENGNRVATVVGVVGDGKYVDIDEAPRPFMYFDLNQHYQPVTYLLARTKGAPRQWLAPLSDALTKTLPGFYSFTLTIDDWLNFALFVPRITLFCMMGLGTLAFTLATVGLYGAVFYSVSERKKELGIRAALGARPQDLRNMILRQTSVVAIAGVCTGMLCGIIATGLVRSLLYGISPVELTVFAVVALIMALMTVLTAYSAARPWLRTDPMESVRHA